MKSLGLSSVLVYLLAVATMFKPSKDSIYLAFEEAKSFDLSFAYRGRFSDEITASFVDLSERAIIDVKGLPKVSKKVSFLLVESFQNIIRHAALKEQEISKTSDNGIFCFRNNGDIYTINSANYVGKEDVKSLISAIELVNSSDRQELRKLYADKLVNGSFSSKGGAGLGIIDIARKSGQNIHYRIDNPVSEMPLYHQQITYLAGAEEKFDSNINESDLMYQYMRNKDALMIYKGDLSKSSIKPIVQILESNFGDSESQINRRKRVIHLLVEMLQNAHLHGQTYQGRKEGVFSIFKSDGRIRIEVGNVIDSSEASELQRKLDEILGSGDLELRSKHKAQLEIATTESVSKSLGIGLLDLARFSFEKLRYSIEKLDEHNCFFILSSSV